MKVLIITSTVAQKISVGKIATELDSYLKSKNIDSFVVYLDGNADNKYKEIRPFLLSKITFHFNVKTNYAFNYTPIALSNLKKILKEYNPDIIEVIQPLSSYIDIYGLFKTIGSFDIPCVYTMIDENAYLGLCDNAYDCDQFRLGCQSCNGNNKIICKPDFNGHWSRRSCRRLARKKIKGYSCVKELYFVAPEWVVERAKESYILRNKKFFVVDEYVNNHDVYYPREISSLCNKYGIDSNKIIITNVARYTNVRKGVELFLELARRLENDSRFLFVNIGYDGKEDVIPKNFIGIPFVADQNELAEFYSLADLSMITSLSDTMPNTSLEALSCGTPVCGFAITGIPYVAPAPLGIYVEPLNIDELKTVVLNTNKKNTDIIKKCREYALKRYAPEISGEKMIYIYKKILNYRI